MLAIIKATILDNIRDRKNTMFLIIFPIFLVFVLGNLLTGAFGGNSVSYNNIEIRYIDEGSEKTKKIFKTLQDISKNNNKDFSFKFTKDVSLDKAKDDVRKNKSILLHLNGDRIDFYSNDDSISKPSFVFATVNSICRKYNAVSAMYKINPQGAMQAVKDAEKSTEKYFTTTKISSKNVTTAMGYYGVAEIGLMIFYFFNMPLYSVIEDRKNNIKDRIRISGIPSRRYYLAVYTANIIYAEACIVISYLVCKFVIGVNYGNNIFILPLAALPFISIIVGIAVMIAVLIKKEETVGVVNNVMQILITFLVFVGGGYIALTGNNGAFFDIAGKISPLKWFNEAVFKSVYAADNSYLINFLIGGAVISVMIYLFISVFSRMEEKYYE